MQKRVLNNNIKWSIVYKNIVMLYTWNEHNIANQLHYTSSPWKYLTSFTKINSKMDHKPKCEMQEL